MKQTVGYISLESIVMMVSLLAVSELALSSIAEKIVDKNTT